MPKPVVSLVKFRDPYGSLKEALRLCGAFEGFQKNDRILIKPNIVIWDFNLPLPYGVITTSAAIFALVQILAEEGFRDLTIGEALPYSRSRGQDIYKALGYEKLVEKYGVKLVDFNEDKFVSVDFGEFSLSVARKALEADKIINVPVLKTHNQCVVSLGIKNLKGCLDRKSKMFCHNVEIDLNHMFPRLIEKLPVALTVIDGVFILEKGPVGGIPHRKNLFLASRDAYACDVVGAWLMGYSAAEVPHLKFYAERHGRDLDLSGIEIKGEDAGAHRTPVDYDWEWTPDNTGPVGFQRRGITGIAARKYDNTMCTGCSGRYNPVLVMLMSAYKGEPFPGIEIVTGKKQMASQGFAKTILFGKCACDRNKNNPNIKKAIPIRGCPPDLNQFVKAMQEEWIACRYDDLLENRKRIFKLYQNRDEFDLGLYVR